MAGEILFFFGGEMGFHNVSFPTDQDYGTEGGPGYDTAIIETTSGAEQRVARHSAARHIFDAAHTIRSPQAIADVLKFYHARRGAAASFRYKDWGDYASNSLGMTHTGSAIDDEDQIIGYGDGSTTQFQLCKVYSDDGAATTRVINLPVESSVLIAIDGVAQASGWSVNDTTGIVTFTTAPSVGEVITAGFEFETKVRFSKDVDVQALKAQISSFDIHEIPSVPLIEVINEAPVPDVMNFGGAKNHGAITADVSITLSQGVHHIVDPAAGLKIYLPEIDWPLSHLADGFGHFYIHNEGTNSIDVVTTALSTVVTIAAGLAAIISVSRDSDGQKTWRALKSSA